MRGLWVEPDTRDDILNFISIITKKTEIKVKNLLKQIDINSSKYYSWNVREGLPNFQNGKIPKHNWLLPWEKDSIISYAKSHVGEGYRRLTYMMMDADVVAVSLHPRTECLSLQDFSTDGMKLKPTPKETVLFNHWVLMSIGMLILNM